MTDDRTEARKARDQAYEKLQEALERTREVQQVAEVSRGWRQRNHFAEMLTKAMESNR